MERKIWDRNHEVRRTSKREETNKDGNVKNMGQETRFPEPQRTRANHIWKCERYKRTDTTRFAVRERGEHTKMEMQEI